MEPRLKITKFKAGNVPANMQLQVLAYMRQKWPHGFKDHNQVRNWIHPDQDHPVHYIVSDQNDNLAAHASLVHRTFEVDGQRLQLGGISGVFTFANYERMGVMSHLLEVLQKDMQELPLDAFLFNCAEELIPFYRKFDWKVIPEARLLIGDNAESALVENEPTLGCTFTAAGEALFEKLQNEGFYFGNYGW